MTIQPDRTPQDGEDYTPPEPLDLNQVHEDVLDLDAFIDADPIGDEEGSGA